MENNLPPRLKKRVLIPILLIFSIIIIFIGYQFYKYEEERVKKEFLKDLKLIAEFKINQIREWRKEKIGTAEVITKSPLFRVSLRKFVEEKSLDDRRYVLERINILKKYGDYESVFISDDKGKVLLSSDTNIKKLDSAFLNDLNLAKSQKTTILTDFKICKGHDKIHILTISPVFADNKRTVAFVIHYHTLNNFCIL